MAQIPILSGIYTDSKADIRVSYPVNMVPVSKGSGISDGYLRPSDGIVNIGAATGEARGGISWNGELYRVMGTNLVKITREGTTTTIGLIPGSGQVIFDYGFDRLAIAADGKLFYLVGNVLSQVTDPDLGTVLDVTWLDGYFVATDGEFLVVTELNDPSSVNPLKYGSSEADPDRINSVMRIRNELYAINRHTIEVFDNVGGDLFPFQRIEGGQIQKGALGTHTSCVFQDTIACLGSGRNEPPAVYLATNAQTTKISTRDIDHVLARFSESVLSECLVESVVGLGKACLYIHLPDRALVFDSNATQETGQPVWYILTSALTTEWGRYKAKDFVWCYDKWNVADPTDARFGYITESRSDHWGVPIRWEFGTLMLYNEGRGAQVQALELVSLTGRNAFGTDPTISTEYSVDGVTWSQPKFIHVGGPGNRLKRLVWFRQGNLRHWRVQRFKGTSDAFLSVARLEAQLEPLNV